ncbi:serine carboxypeptidase-like 50 [Phalaenopsis equestris]|uniref:serine carboxypeptidase-like 50 n=1 Tax=Phalaenopsis equestris TaxID=78828 RepID=UPI0009E23BFA|nr:serine carboxypeptidase-like 50 [Phalaenopsis equestris]
MHKLSIPELHSSRNLEQPALMAPSSALLTLPSLLFAFLLLLLLLLLLSPTVSSIPPPEILYPKQAVPTKSGYLPTNSSSSSLFFAFYEAQKPLTSPSSTPIILWLQGGPGCSSMIGHLFEFGPYLLSSHLHLLPNPFTWNRRFALLFIDSPIAAGFSHSSSPIPRDQNSIASNLYSALQSFLSSQPPFFRSRPLFLSGQSYGGKFVVSSARHILLQNQNPIVPPSLRINLAGISIGNGMIHPVVQIRVHAAAAYSFGLINERQRAKLEKMQEIKSYFLRDCT